MDVPHSNSLVGWRFPALKYILQKQVIVGVVCSGDQNIVILRSVGDSCEDDLHVV